MIVKSPRNASSFFPTPSTVTIYVTLAVVLLLILTTSRTASSQVIAHQQQQQQQQQQQKQKLQPSPPSSLHTCPHIVLISAARHGSTWLIDCAEHCRNAHDTTGTFGKLNSAAELWNAAQGGAAENFTAEQAASYVANNMSVKLFPVGLETDRQRAAQLFQYISKFSIPVFVLRRDLKTAYGSLQIAKHTHTWNLDTRGAPGRTQRNGVAVDDHNEAFVKYRDRMIEYFDQLAAMMQRAGVVWDTLHYEQIVTQQRIVGQRNQCYIRNCNFS